MSSLLFFRTSRRPPVSTGATHVPRALPPDSDGSLTAMAKGVNDVLNSYIQVSDTKASIFIAGSVAAATFLLMKFPTDAAARTLYFSAAACPGMSLVLATLVILPRLPTRNGEGSVFWGDIAGCGSPAEYRDRFGATASAGSRSFRQAGWIFCNIQVCLDSKVIDESATCDLFAEAQYADYLPLIAAVRDAILEPSRKTGRLPKWLSMTVQPARRFARHGISFSVPHPCKNSFLE